MGTGHVMRCLALAQEWQKTGGKAILLSHCESTALRHRLDRYVGTRGWGAISVSRVRVSGVAATESKLVDDGTVLRARHRLTVVTNSAFVASTLAMIPGNNVSMAGTQLRDHDGAAFDRRIEIDCTALAPMVTWGTSPAQVLPLGAPVLFQNKVRSESKKIYR